MLTHGPQDSTASRLRTADVPANDDRPDPRAVIEVASAGTATTNDPSGADKPPAVPAGH